MDANITKVMAEITSKIMLNKILLRDKVYHVAWNQSCFAVEDGTLLYYSEGHQGWTRKLCVHVVPPTLRMAVVAGCYTSPMVGHIISAHTIFRATS